MEEDSSSLAWVNALLAGLWPKASAALKRYVHDELTPLIQGGMPAPLKQVHFARFNLGQGIPHFGDIQVTRHSDSHAQLDLHVSYASDVDVLLDLGAGGISLGIRSVSFEARLCVALRPLLQELPVIGGVHVCFASRPRVELKFCGLASAVELPGVAEQVQTSVDDLLDTWVVPNGKSFTLAPGDRLAKAEPDAVLQRPLGALRVRVLGARNLAGVHLQLCSVQSSAPDPYCALRLGASTSRTSAVRGSANPRWPEDEPESLFLVHHFSQELEISVLSEGQGGLVVRSFASLLGRSSGLSVRSLLQGAAAGCDGGALRQRFTAVLDTSGAAVGPLHIDDPLHAAARTEVELGLEWLSLAPAPALGQSPAASLAAGDPWVVLVGLHSGTGFPPEGKGLRWRCRMGTEEDSAPALSCAGQRAKAPPAPELLDRPLMTVVDQLLRRSVPVAEIADIIDVKTEVVWKYLREREDRKAVEERQREEGVELQWHQTLPLLAKEGLGRACLLLELVEGDGKVVGQLAPMPPRPLAETSARSHALQPISAEPVCGLSSLFLFRCGAPEELCRSAYREVSMDISVQCHRLAVGAAAPAAVLLGRAAGAGGGAKAAAEQPEPAPCSRSRQQIGGA
mmetsp:Transcript_24126/g.71809  ORF Transcript_24126/g.71809 Transcript_24126/m.71809 type:complete len:625 (-) Transcript_24126:35-1909(-)